MLTLMKAKANITLAISELIQIASDKSEYPDYSNKHGAKAKFGWYHYNTRFGIPVYDEEGNLERYNIFGARVLVRCDADGKLYLYDLVRTKKETSKPHKHRLLEKYLFDFFENSKYNELLNE